MASLRRWNWSNVAVRLPVTLATQLMIEVRRINTKASMSRQTLEWNSTMRCFAIAYFPKQNCLAIKGARSITHFHAFRLHYTHMRLFHDRRTTLLGTMETLLLQHKFGNVANWCLTSSMSSPSLEHPLLVWWYFIVVPWILLYMTLNLF